MHQVGNFVADMEIMHFPYAAVKKSRKWTLFEIVLMFIDTQCLQKHLEHAIQRVMYFDTLYVNTTIWNETAERYLCGQCWKERSVGIYPSVVFYFHVRREIEGAGGGKPQTFLLFYYFLSGMRSYLRRIKYEKPFRKLQLKMLTINR